MAMMYRIPLLGALALVLVAQPVAVRAQLAGDEYSIMAPEKVPAKNPSPKASKRRRRGSSTLVTPTPLPPPLHYVVPPVPTAPPTQHIVPPSLYVPQTGAVLPNLGAGTGETSQDRAARCAHQVGMYGPARTGNRNAYIGACINQ